jgi:hypothetical protein
MTGVARLVDFVWICALAAIIWLVASRLWPVLGLVAPVGALIAILVAANLVDGLWFAIRHRHSTSSAGVSSAATRAAGNSASPAVQLGGTR